MRSLFLAVLVLGLLSGQVDAKCGADANGGGQTCENAAAPSIKATYSFATLALSPASAATDIVTLTGSSTKVVRLVQLTVCGTATAPSTIDVVLVERSTANSGGTSSAPTMVSLDTGDAAATAAVAAYTANPTVGSLVGNIRGRKLNLATTSGGAGCLIFDFSTRNGKGPILRDALHTIALNLNGASIPAGAALDIDAEWTEE